MAYNQPVKDAGQGLPHWDMFKRRLWRTPGRWAIALGLAWILLTLWFPRELIDDLLPRSSWYFPLYSDIALLSCGLLGYAWLYYVIAQGMSQLADTGGSTGWYLSTLKSTSALNGVLLTTFVQSSVGLAGLLAFTSAQLIAISRDWELYNPFAQLGGDLFNCYPFTALLLLRLPHYALFCACLSIALRNTSLRSMVPLVCTLAATAAIFVPTREYYLGSVRGMYSSTTVTHIPLLHQHQLLLPMVGAGLVLLLCILFVGQSHRGLPAVLRPLLFAPPVLAVLGGATGIALAVDSLLPNSQLGLEDYLSNRPLFQLAHAFLSHMFPNLMLTWTGGGYYFYMNSAGSISLLGEDLTTAGQWLWPVASYLLTLGLWYVTALACLNAARRPSLPLRRLLSG